MRYLQVKNTYITDSIDYEYGDYIRFDGVVPIDIMNQCYQLLNEDIVLDEVKHQEFLAEQELIEQELAEQV